MIAIPTEMAIEECASPSTTSIVGIPTLTGFAIVNVPLSLESRLSVEMAEDTLAYYYVAPFERVAAVF